MLKKVRSNCIFTTHTPVEAAQDKFSYDLIKEVLGDYVPLEVLKSVGGKDQLNMTRLALNLSDYINGVPKRHQESSREMFPGYEIHAITNGIHSYTWTSESFRRLYDKYLPSWANEPNLLVRVDIIPDEEIWQAHKEAKKMLIDHVNKVANIHISSDLLTIGFVKRATLIFSDPQKLRRISRKTPMQIIFAGKAHPKDQPGKKIIEQIFSYTQKLKEDIKIAYLENYDLKTAALVTAGVDVWLNTPQPPFEASGTSGMKAAHNGIINFSVLDGWWIEGWIEGITGWSIGPPPEERTSPEERSNREIDDLYNKLEYIIAPMFYKKRDDWIRIMKNSIGKIAYYFNSHRMMRRYVTEAYF